MAVGRRQFKAMCVAAVRALAKPTHVLFDIKHVFTAAEVDGPL